MGAKVGLSHCEETCREAVWEEDAMKDTWTKEGGSNSRLDKTACSVHL